MPFIGNLGPTELIIVLIIALLILGPGKLPEVGSALGKSIREFRKAATDVKEAASLAPIAPEPAASVPTSTAPSAVSAPAASVEKPSETPAGTGPDAPVS